MATPIYPATYQFPPNAPVTMTTVINSYPYQEYSDDETVYSFFDAYNQMGQNYIDTVNGLNLPIYTANNIVGPLLDWVAGGIYGYARPSLSSGITNPIGTLNTFELNTLMLNTYVMPVTGPSTLV